MDRKPTNYLVVFHLSQSDQKIIGRLSEHGPVIREILKQVSVRGVEPVMVFRSHDSATFGYCIRSRRPAAAIVSQLDSPGSNQAEWGADDPQKKISLTSPLHMQDRVFVIDIGTDFASIRFAGHLTWFKQVRRLDESES